MKKFIPFTHSFSILCHVVMWREQRQHLRKDVVALIDKGAEQQDSIDNGTLDISDIPEADYFNTPQR